MTLKAFMKKYGITSYLVTKVAEITKHTATEERDIDYLEADLVASLIEIYNKKIQDALNTAHFYGTAIAEAENIFRGRRGDKQ